MKRGIVAAISLILETVLLVSCAPTAPPAPAPQAPAPAGISAPAPPKVTVAPAKPSWQAEWERVLEAAKRESEVSIVIGATGPTVRSALAGGFKKAHGISLESISAKAAEAANRVMSERRAGIYSYDVYALGTGAFPTLKSAGAFDSLEPALILPEVTNPELIKKTWWGEKLWWLDGDHMALVSALRTTVPIAINTSLVKEGEVKSFRDLLSPKWRGKIILSDPTIGGGGANFLQFVNAQLGWGYLEELAKTAEPVVMRDDRLELDWLAHGKVAIVVLPSEPLMVEFAKVGAPIKGLIPVEGTWLSVVTGLVSLFNKAPHPNAAKLYVNWLLSKEGQSTLVVPLVSQSLRLDVPADHLSVELQLQPGMKYFLADEKTISEQPALQKKAGELLRSLIAK